MSDTKDINILEAFKIAAQASKDYTDDKSITSTIIGKNNEIENPENFESCIVIGENNTSKGGFSNVAIGRNNSVGGADSIALGNSLYAYDNQVVLGAHNKPDGDAAFIIADGGASHKDYNSNIFTLKNNGAIVTSAQVRGEFVPGVTERENFTPGSDSLSIGSVILKSGAEPVTSDGWYAPKDLRFNEAYGTGSTASGMGAVAYSRASKSLGYRTQTGYPPSEEIASKRPEVISGVENEVYTDLAQFTIGEITGLCEGVQSGEVKHSMYLTVYPSEDNQYSCGIQIFISQQEKCSLTRVLLDVTKIKGNHDYLQIGIYKYDKDGNLLEVLWEGSEVISDEGHYEIPLHNSRSNFTDYYEIRFYGKGSYNDSSVTIDTLRLEAEYTKTTYPIENVGQAAIATGSDTAATGNNSWAGGYSTKASGLNACALGSTTIASGQNAFTIGKDTIADGLNSFAGGSNSQASGSNAFAFGAKDSTSGKIPLASGYSSAVLNQGCRANGSAATAMNYLCEATNQASLATGYNTLSKNIGSFTSGLCTQTDVNYQAVVGKYNKSTDGKGLFVVGFGTSTNRKNGLVVNNDGTVQAYSEVGSMGADYAEFFEWKDGNPDAEDRVGMVVTLDGEQIRLAEAGDEILGIVSGTVAVLGDSASMHWKNQYLTDEFGRLIYDMVEEFIDSVDEAGEIIQVSAGFFPHARLNPDYDPEMVYIPREDRPEWDKVGMLGKLYTRDDGTCAIGGYGCVGENGILTKSEEPTNIRIMKRTANNIVQVLLK